VFLPFSPSRAFWRSAFSCRAGPDPEMPVPVPEELAPAPSLILLISAAITCGVRQLMKLVSVVVSVMISTLLGAKQLLLTLDLP